MSDKIVWAEGATVTITLTGEKAMVLRRLEANPAYGVYESGYLVRTANTYQEVFFRDLEINA